MAICVCRRVELLLDVGPGVDDRRHPEPEQQRRPRRGTARRAGRRWTRRAPGRAPSRTPGGHRARSGTSGQVVDPWPLSVTRVGAEQHDHLQEEVDDRRADDGQREQLAREVDLVDQAGVADDRAGAAADDVGEQGPGEQAGEQVDAELRDRLAVAEELADRDGVDDQLEQRPDERPEEAEHAVLVLDLQLFAGPAGRAAGGTPRSRRRCARTRRRSARGSEPAPWAAARPTPHRAHGCSVRLRPVVRVLRWTRRSLCSTARTGWLRGTTVTGRRPDSQPPPI